VSLPGVEAELDDVVIFVLGRWLLGASSGKIQAIGLSKGFMLRRAEIQAIIKAYLDQHCEAKRLGRNVQ
jgi:hypothetical protein